MQLRRGLRLAAALGGIVWGSAVVAAQTSLPLPEGPERAWVGTYCARCHEGAWIAQAGGTELRWATVIRRMIRRGAEIPADRIAPLARYLAAALPARVRAAEIATSPINTTVSRVEVRALQVWVRTAGRVGSQPRSIVAPVGNEWARIVRPGQRVRAFQLRSRASMYQGLVVGVELEKEGATVQVALRVPAVGGEDFVLEIIADLGPHLSVPNEAVIEEGERQLVYVRQLSGDYVPREIRTGRRGELFVEVSEGLKEGEEVVTFGSFFIDAEFRMKGLAGP